MTAVVESAIPTGREEAWRFTPLKRLRGLHERISDSRETDFDVQCAPEARFSVVGRDEITLSASREWPAGIARQATERVGVLTVPIGSQGSGDHPSTVTFTGSDADVTTTAQLVVMAEAGSRATVVIEFVGSATLSSNIDLVVRDDADLTVVVVHDWAPDTVHLGSLHASLGRNSRVRTLVATLGGDVVRIVPTVEYTAPGGDAEMLGLFFAETGQHIEHRLFVDHTQPHCRSNVVYKGALHGSGAHTVWIGDVIIRANAIGTDTYEINRNLLLSDGARADSVPNLEIETGSVAGAGHASATGRFDDEQLFYLQSRGIDSDTARRLVVRGFFADIISRIDAGGVSDRLMASIEAKLSASLANAEGGKL